MVLPPPPTAAEIASFAPTVADVRHQDIPAYCTLWHHNSMFVDDNGVVGIRARILDAIRNSVASAYTFEFRRPRPRPPPRLFRPRLTGRGGLPPGLLLGFRRLHPYAHPQLAGREAPPTPRSAARFLAQRHPKNRPTPTQDHCQRPRPHAKRRLCRPTVPTPVFASSTLVEHQPTAPRSPANNGGATDSSSYLAAPAPISL